MDYVRLSKHRNANLKDSPKLLIESEKLFLVAALSHQAQWKIPETECSLLGSCRVTNYQLDSMTQQTKLGERLTAITASVRVF